MRVQETAVQTDRVLTIPNVLTILRLLAIPLFLWLMLGPEADGWAALVLVLSAFTDWLDGYLARRMGTISRIGQLLDPLADRLYILATLFALLWRELLPWWVPAVIIGRDLFLALLLSRLKRYGIVGLPVHFVGKAATFNLMIAFPLLVLGGDGALPVARVLGLTFAGWGTGLYLYAGWLYVRQARPILASPPPVRSRP